MLKSFLYSVALFAIPALADETARALPLPQQDVPQTAELQTAVLAGGCFWGMQGVFQHLKGVREVKAGYAGGAASTARYDAVEWGNTGHAESVRIVFDPREVSYGRILQVFFSVMDPTTLNHQGPDDGTQYRSEIFAADSAQQRAAQSYIGQLTAAHAFGAPIVTRLSVSRSFYEAEAWHQNYLIKHPDQTYIVINDQPKIAKLRNLYPDLYRAQPVAR